MPQGAQAGRTATAGELQAAAAREALHFQQVADRRHAGLVERVIPIEPCQIRHTRIQIHRANGMSGNLILLADRCMGLMIKFVRKIRMLLLRLEIVRLLTALLHKELTQIAILLFARHLIQAHQRHLGDLMSRIPLDLTLLGSESGIDEIRIMRRAYQSPEFQSAEYGGKIGFTQYLPQGGRFVSRPIMVSNGSILKELNAEVNVPSQTEVSFFVRSGDNFFNWTDNYPEWKSVKSGELISGVNGLYFQVAAELLPDGNGGISPSITEIALTFEELPEPLPPFVVKAVAGNACVTVSWNYSVDDTAGGYYLYYGNRPGEYLGRIAVEGESPIDVGNTTSFTVTGLENGKIYYFALAAWSAHDKRVVGELSKEVFARPLAYR